jgi:hypothetical protein
MGIRRAIHTEIGILEPSGRPEDLNGLFEGIDPKGAFFKDNSAIRHPLFNFGFTRPS